MGLTCNIYGETKFWLEKPHGKIPTSET